jgi:hypothetical protein
MPRAAHAMENGVARRRRAMRLLALVAIVLLPLAAWAADEPEPISPDRSSGSVSTSTVIADTTEVWRCGSVVASGLLEFSADSRAGKVPGGVFRSPVAFGGELEDPGRRAPGSCFEDEGSDVW